jgi:hypothetical protein
MVRIFNGAVKVVDKPDRRQQESNRKGSCEYIHRKPETHHGLIHGKMHHRELQTPIEKKQRKEQEQQLAHNPGHPWINRKTLYHKIQPDVLVVTHSGGYADRAQPYEEVLTQFIGENDVEVHVPRQYPQHYICNHKKGEYAK